MATILLTGGSGMIGRQLTELLLDKGYSVIIIGRSINPFLKHPMLSYATWNLNDQTIDTEAIQSADYIINLAGAGVADKRWSEERKQEIVTSRINAGQTLVKALTQIPNKVKAVVNASAIGWYGADTATSLQHGFSEDAAADTQFLGETCKLWEESVHPISQLGKRLVVLRIGIVLSKNGGAFAEFLKPVKLGVAGILGSGKQIISWIHVHDLCQMFIYAIENNTMQGAYNAVAARPVSNKHLTIALANKVKGKFYIPIHVPSFVLKIMLGEMSIEVLKSATVSNKKIKQTGFSYLYNTVEAAIDNLV